MRVILFALLLSGCVYKTVEVNDVLQADNELRFFQKERSEFCYLQFYKNSKGRLNKKVGVASLEQQNQIYQSKSRLLGLWQNDSDLNDILFLGEECAEFEFLLLQWWSAETSERRIYILLLFFEYFNPSLSSFPPFEVYSERFEKKECETRQEELNFVKQKLSMRNKRVDV